ncbi:MAG TPA: 50S ribosomal protein L11 methyltransferase [Blastocatellia bacterium]|nr:50S ribosomal protein L11 methyltransferase [Blastocatellia bacterium]
MTKKREHKHETEPADYVHIQHIFKGQGPLIDDLRRNRAFYSALKKHVTPDSAVLDIGAGTGLWAIAAARLGARKVVAIERDEYLIPIIKNLVRENRVEDRVEVVYGVSNDVSPEGKFDVVISETVGNQVFDELIVPNMIDARKRFLKRGGVLIPSSVALLAAPARFKKNRHSPAGVPIECSYFDSLNVNMPVLQNDKSRLTLLAPAERLLEVDLNTVKKPPELVDLTARWTLKDASGINCFAVWGEMTLTEGLTLSTYDTSSWSPILYLVKPFKEAKGDVEFKFSMANRSYYWTTTISNGTNRESQSHSPVFTFTSIMAHTKMMGLAAKK